MRRAKALILLTVILFRRNSVSLRLCFATSFVWCAAIVILTFAYFVPRDLILLTWSILDHLDQIRAVSTQWSHMNCLRSLFGLAGVLFSLKGLDIGDAYVRTHYQIWHYVYPTGQSLFYSAKGLRDSLDALKRAVALAPLRATPASASLLRDLLTAVAPSKRATIFCIRYSVRSFLVPSNNLKMFITPSINVLVLLIAKFMVSGFWTEKHEQ
jgi:hypothetical protein